MKLLPVSKFGAIGLLLLTGGMIPAAAAAQAAADTLGAQVRVEERLLERAREQYREARAVERDVLRQLRDSGNEQDDLLDQVLRRVLGRAASEVEENDGAAGGALALLPRLRTAERELAGTRETALALVRESAEARRDLIARAARIAELRAEIERLSGARLVDPTGLDGRWRIELAGAGITGVVDLTSNGTLVSGTYRLENGAQGSLRGTFSGGRLELDRIDWSRGFDTTLRGELDASAGVIQGTWLSVDVSGGLPTSGSWTARRVEP